MVSILPSQRTGMDVLGEHIGAGMQRAMPQMYENQKFQRGMSAIDQLQASLQPKLDANGQPIPQNPGEMISHLARAISANPALERSGLGSKMLEMIQSGMYPGALGEGAGQPQQPMPMQPPNAQAINNQPPGPVTETPQQTAPKNEAPKAASSAKDIDSAANQYIAEVRPDLVNPESQFGAINTFDSAVKMDLSPEEEAGLRQKLQDRYKNPNIVNQVVDRVREGIKNRFDEAQKKYGFDADKRKQIQDKWDTFTTGADARIAPHLEKFEQFPRTKEELKNKYFQYAGGESTNLTPQQMHANAMSKLQKDLNSIDALHAQPSMPPVRSEKEVKDYFDTNKNQYKSLVDNGLLEVAREDAIMNKDMGNEEFHGAVWGDQTNKDLLNRLNSFKAPIEYPQSKLHTGAIEYNKNYNKEKEKYISDLSSNLQKLSPKDDLILARAMVLNNDGTIKDFNDALRKAQEDGLELSEFQKSQLQEINIPRTPPLWELFNQKNLLSISKTWAPWINYIRGKK